MTQYASQTVAAWSQRLSRTTYAFFRINLFHPSFSNITAKTPTEKKLS
jgi:hypothetical protein